ncbi:Ribose-5-phosphate isomerase A [Frankliniella fusca]|uniref:Ribose-5-phosphate isomerase A n=1 Tax=Frankliniella fusca TaxID=407009 RepID=A0AAE1LL07_9NEOP|nr:Ribose-5-phosphate isomerase A [Frankliniella fusca]
MTDAARPGPVKLRDGNIAANWADFEQRFDIYIKSNPSRVEAPINKWAVLMNEAGNEALEIYNGFKASLIVITMDEAGNIVKTDNSENYDVVVAEFRKYVEQRKSVTSIRAAFRKRKQRPGEPFANWYTDLKIKIKDCEYGAIADSMMKDQ